MNDSSSRLTADDLWPVYLNHAERASVLFANPSRGAYDELVALTRQWFEEDGFDPGEAESFVVDLREAPPPPPVEASVPDPMADGDPMENPTHERADPWTNPPRGPEEEAPEQSQAAPSETPLTTLEVPQDDSGGSTASESLPGPSESLPEVDRVRAVLSNGPLPGCEVARRAGLRWSTAFRKLAELQAGGLVTRTGRARRSRYALAGSVQKAVR